MRIFKIAAVLLPLISVSGIAQSNAKANMKGVVATLDGKAVPAAFILVRDYQQPSQDYVAHNWETRTEADGSFSLLMEPGCYDIFVSANAQFLPSSMRVCFQVQPSPVLKIKLKADPHPRMPLS